MEVGFDVLQFVKDFQIVTCVALVIFAIVSWIGFNKRMDKADEKAEKRSKFFHEKINEHDSRLTKVETDIEHVAGTRWKHK